MKGGTQDIKEHPWCVGFDWEHPHKHRVVSEHVRPFDREQYEWLPAVSVITAGRETIEANKQSQFDGF